MQLSLGPYRRYLARYESVRAYALLGIAAGLVSGLAVIAFERAIDEFALLWGVGGGGEDFESLPAWARFALPAGSALLLGLLYHVIRPEDRETGIVHVISRLHTSYGILPWRNALLQLLAGASLLASGQSGGREGPGVHLGGAAASLLGQLLSLPHTSLRVLIACGTAGGIAAAFNTPLAGVIFAMEVIICEYTVSGFLPVLLAAVCAATLTRELGGGSSVFTFDTLQLGSLWDLPYILILGLACGIASAMFVRVTTLAARLHHWPVSLRFALAGTLTGALGIVVPEVLGVGYDSLSDVLYGEVAFTALLLIAGGKLFTTAIGVGVGMPLGLIGPSLLFGACIGAFFGNLGPLLSPALSSDVTLYATLGMAAAMGAVFAAPLAATLAVIELTQSTTLATPVMLAIAAAHLTNLSLFRQRAVHQSLLQQLQRQLPGEPLSQLLHRTDVNTVLDSSVLTLGERMDSALHEALQQQLPNWCVISRKGEDLCAVRGEELFRWLGDALAPQGEDPEANFSESDIPRWSTIAVPEQASLQQAFDVMRRHKADLVCVYGRSGRRRELRGVITRERIEHFTLSRLDS